MPSGRVASINVSAGGVPKTAVAEAGVTEAGVAGDRPRDLRPHGGPDRAVSLFSLEAIHALRGEGHPIGAGTTGENLTVSGVIDFGGREISLQPLPRCQAETTPHGTACLGRDAEGEMPLSPE